MSEKPTPDQSRRVRIAAVALCFAVLAAGWLVLRLATLKAPGWLVLAALLLVGFATRSVIIFAWRKAGCFPARGRTPEPINEFDNTMRIVKAICYGGLFLFSSSIAGMASHNKVFSIVAIFVGYIGFFAITFGLARHYGAWLAIRRHPDGTISRPGQSPKR